jgi:hypothetical protein
MSHGATGHSWPDSNFILADSAACLSCCSIKWPGCNSNHTTHNHCWFTTYVLARWCPTQPSLPCTCIPSHLPTPATLLLLAPTLLAAEMAQKGDFEFLDLPSSRSLASLTLAAM